MLIRSSPLIGTTSFPAGGLLRLWLSLTRWRIGFRRLRCIRRIRVLLAAMTLHRVCRFHAPLSSDAGILLAVAVGKRLLVFAHCCVALAIEIEHAPQIDV